MAISSDGGHLAGLLYLLQEQVQSLASQLDACTQAAEAQSGDQGPAGLAGVRSGLAGCSAECITLRQVLHVVRQEVTARMAAGKGLHGRGHWCGCGTAPTDGACPAAHEQLRASCAVPDPGGQHDGPFSSQLRRHATPAPA